MAADQRTVSLYYMDPNYLLEALSLLHEVDFLRKCLVDRHGERTVGPDPLRQTGRTTFALIEVLRLSLKKPVIFVGDEQALSLARDLLQAWIKELGLADQVGDRIRLVHPEQLEKEDRENPSLGARSCIRDHTVE